MAKSKSRYKEQILEKMRTLHAQLDLLAEILKEAQDEKSEDKK